LSRKKPPVAEFKSRTYIAIMSCDIVALRAFYASAVGKLVERSLGQALQKFVKPFVGQRVLGFGYPTPWLDVIGVEAERTLAFMPAGQGAYPWPVKEPTRTALVFEEDLPLPDAAVDTVLMVHALEHAQSPRDTLAEFWRVLSPNGRLIIVVPSRRGLWARFEHTPFGTGRPYSMGQMKALLRDAGFSVEETGEALHSPPFKRRAFMKFWTPFETTGQKLWPVFAGVLIIEARKRVFQGIAVTPKKSRRVFVPVLAPQGYGRGEVNHAALDSFQT
jgi:SAM-dependent methyltransferase